MMLAQHSKRAEHLLAPEHVVLGVTLFGAGAALFAWQRSPSASLLAHSAGAAHQAPTRFVVFVAAWALMSVITMLPSTVSVLTFVRRVAAPRIRSRHTAVAAAVAGMLAVWCGAGALAAIADASLHQAVEAGTIQVGHRTVLGMLLVGGGAYQASPFAMRCLTACRSPFGFVARHWREGNAHARATMIGADYGRSCLACCAGLMAVMCAVGMASPFAMLGAAGWTLLTKRASRGVALMRPTGAVLVAAGLAVLGASLMGVR